MQLLVSLRAADEVGAALAGGADIIDAKEPERGSLGPVAPEVLRAISARVPATMPLSVALGDFTAAEAVREAVAAASPRPRRAPVYLKLGFAGARSPSAVRPLVAAAIESAALAPARPIVVPVAYADWREAGSPAPEDVLAAAIAAGARAFLVDTCTKDGKGLLDRLELGRVRALATEGRAAGLLVALAGSLDLVALDRIAGLADVVGIRGGACLGGRTGRLDAGLIRRFRDRMESGTQPLSTAI
ncbi:MAG: (5-formylfuran-3-yl)methyl phosphate synthase [Gemmatimonadales bacterium]